MHSITFLDGEDRDEGAPLGVPQGEEGQEGPAGRDGRDGRGGQKDDRELDDQEEGLASARGRKEHRGKAHIAVASAGSFAQRAARRRG